MPVAEDARRITQIHCLRFSLTPVWLDFLQYPLPSFPDFHGDSQFFILDFISPSSESKTVSRSD